MRPSIIQLNLFSQRFQKLASTIQVPDSILKPAQDFIRAAYAKFLLLDFDDLNLPETKQTRAFHLFLQKDAKNYKEHEGNYIGTTIDVPLNKLPYDKSLPIKLRKLSFGIHLEDKQEHNKDWLGLWKNVNPLNNGGYIGTIFIRADFQENIQNLKSHHWHLSAYEYIVTQLLETTRHECQHLVQSFLDYTLVHGYRGDIYGGVPPKLSKPNYKEDEAQEYALRDIEFQTNLQDAIDGFKMVAPMVPHENRSDILKFWLGEITEDQLSRRLQQTLTGQSFNKQQADILQFAVNRVREMRQNILTLREKAPEKYRLATREMARLV